MASHNSKNNKKKKKEKKRQNYKKCISRFITEYDEREKNSMARDKTRALHKKKHNNNNKKQNVNQRTLK